MVEDSSRFFLIPNAQIKRKKRDVGFAFDEKLSSSRFRSLCKHYNGVKIPVFKTIESEDKSSLELIDNSDDDVITEEDARELDEHAMKLLQKMKMSQMDLNLIRESVELRLSQINLKEYVSNKTRESEGLKDDESLVAMRSVILSIAQN